MWQRISLWTKASDVEFEDGVNAETKMGSIYGITDSLTSTSNVAASAAAVKALNDKITEINGNISYRRISTAASDAVYNATVTIDITAKSTRGILVMYCQSYIGVDGTNCYLIKQF